MTQADLISVPAGTDGDTNQRYTDPKFLKWAMEKAEVDHIDLDAAACPESHHAPIWYGRQTDGSWLDGLKLRWFGITFFNGPWDDLNPWYPKAWTELELAIRGDSLAGLPPLSTIFSIAPQGRTHRPWWAECIEPFRDHRCVVPFWKRGLRVFFPPFRPHYGHPGNPTGVGVGEPNFGSVVIVWKHPEDWRTP